MSAIKFSRKSGRRRGEYQAGDGALEAFARGGRIDRAEAQGVERGHGTGAGGEHIANGAAQRESRSKRAAHQHTNVLTTPSSAATPLATLSELPNSFSAVP